MEKGRKKFIGLYGEAGSGKDYFCSMLQFFIEYGYLESGSLVSLNDDNQIIKTYAKFLEWKRDKGNNPIPNNIWEKSTRLAFADIPKEAMSSVYGIPLELLHDSKKKDLTFINLKTLKLSESPFENRDGSIAIWDQEFYEMQTSDTNNHDRTAEQSQNIMKLQSLFADGKLWMSIRNLMTYFGTYLCRGFIDPNIWVTRLLNHPDFEREDKIIIVTDIRFINEHDALKSNDFTIIRIDNPTNEKNVGGIAEKHYAEFKPDYVFTNKPKDMLCTLREFKETLLWLYERFNNQN